MDNIVKIVEGISLFALTTCILYIWGLKKSISQQEELLNNLYSKGIKKVKKRLKNQSYITKMEIESEVENIRVSQIFSRKKAIVKDKREFSKVIIDIMVGKSLIVEEFIQNKRVYKLKAHSKSK